MNTKYQYTAYPKDGAIKLSQTLFAGDGFDRELLASTSTTYTVEDAIHLIVSLEAVLSELKTGESVDAVKRLNIAYDRISKFEEGK
jgi:hypothetical protein